MFRAIFRPVVLAMSIQGSFIAVAAAQQIDGRDIVYESARNRIGLLRYCQKEALLDARTTDVALQVAQRGLASFPSANAPAIRRFGDQAEEDGEIGIVGPDSRRDIGDFARLFKTTPSVLCKEWAASSLQGVTARGLQRLSSEKPGSSLPARYLPPQEPNLRAPAPQPAITAAPSFAPPPAPQSYPATPDLSTSNPFGGDQCP